MIVSRNYYSEINLHITWHTKNSSSLLDTRLEARAYNSIRERIHTTPGVYLHAIGGIETHVHLAVTVPPTLTLREWIGQLKGGSAHDVNQLSETRDKELQWQTGYGVVSFGTKDLPWVIEYIRRQREHHAQGTTTKRLESIDQFGE
jgi:putative transposase